MGAGSACHKRWRGGEPHRRATQSKGPGWQVTDPCISQHSDQDKLSGTCQLAFVVGLFVLLLPFSLLDDDGENKESTPPLPEMEEEAVKAVNPLSLQRF